MAIIHADGSGFNGRISRLCVINLETGGRIVDTTNQKWTNNTAEYNAVLAAITMASWGDTICTDSQVVYMQVNGEHRCNFEHLRVLRDEVRKKLLEKNCKLEMIPGKENQANLFLKRRWKP